MDATFRVLAWAAAILAAAICTALVFGALFGS